MKKLSLGVVIVARNEDRMIGGCLESVGEWAPVLVVDMNSTDHTTQIAQKAGARVESYPWNGYDYASPRNWALKLVDDQWLMYLDADERLTPALKEEMAQVIRGPGKYSAYALPRRNIILGKEFRYGGQWPDYVIRLFKVSDFKGWEGKVHEQPRYEGVLGYLKHPLVHDKHETISEMVDKTNQWSGIEAKLLFEAHHPSMVGWRFFRIILSEMWLKLILQKGFLDGARGVIYALYQMWSRYLTYAKLWELQKQN